MHIKCSSDGNICSPHLLLPWQPNPEKNIYYIKSGHHILFSILLSVKKTGSCKQKLLSKTQILCFYPQNWLPWQPCNPDKTTNERQMCVLGSPTMIQSLKHIALTVLYLLIKISNSIFFHSKLLWLPWQPV